MNLLLFGFKGSGKTHFGKLLAHEMKRPFIDMDDLIAELYLKKNGKKRRAREIFSELGELSFRALEKEAVRLFEGIQNGIIALGGGTVLDPTNVEMLRRFGTLVYLKASGEILRKRIFAEELPAYFDKAKPEESFRKMLQEREPIYRSIQAEIIDTDLLDEAGVIAALKSILIF